METESVKSALSEQSAKSRKSRHRSNYKNHSLRSGRNRKLDNGMAPFQTAVTINDDSRDGQEVIEVQILPQDENWGENTTAVTGNTSEQSESIEDVSQWANDSDMGFSFACQKFIGSTLTGFISAAAFLSPLAMVVLPKIGIHWYIYKICSIAHSFIEHMNTRQPDNGHYALGQLVLKVLKMVLGLLRCMKYIHFLDILPVLLAVGYINGQIQPYPRIVFGVFTALNPATTVSQQHRVALLSCGAECKGLLVSLAFKLVLLAAGAWAVFLRQYVATLPRIFLFRAAILILVFVCTFTYWLFYIVQVTEQAALATEPDAVRYSALVSYASSLSDTLLFILFIAVVLLEIKHLQPTYYIKVVRSPDGESRSYAVGQLSIQRASVWILQKYYTEFSIYNPYLERLPVSKSRKGGGSSFKFYEVDGITNNTLQNSQSRAMLTAHARRRDSSHNERFYEEHEYERRVKKRRARLVTAAEEAFTHIKRLHNDQVSGIPMDPTEAAQAVFPSLSRALQKYLRVTRQQPRHTVDTILSHLAMCLRHDLTPRAFLEPFLVPAPVMQNEKEQKPLQSWSLICEELLSRPLRHGTTFQLRQNDVSLLCQVRSLPHFHITEEIMDPKSNKFVLRINSETSV